MSKTSKRRNRRARLKRVHKLAAARHTERIGAIRLCETVSDFQLQAAAEGDGKKLRKYSMTAYTGAAMNVGWGPPVVVDLSGMKVASQRLPNFLNHDPSAIVGHSESIEVSAQRVYVNGVMSGVGSASQELLALASNGFPWQASIGADVHKSELIDAGETVKVNGKNHVGPIIVARQSTLQEISFTPIGADNQTTATVAAKQHKGDFSMSIKAAMGFDEWLTNKGFKAEELSEKSRTFLSEMWADERAKGADAEDIDEPEDDEEEDEDMDAKAAATKIPDLLAQHRIKVAADVQRMADIARICASDPSAETEITERGKKVKVNLQAHAIKHGWTAEETSREFELIELRAKLANPVIVRGHDSDCTLEAMTGAMLLRAGQKLDNPIFNTQQAVAAKLPKWLRAGLNDDQRQRSMEAAHKFADMSMVDLCAEAVRLDGKTVPTSKEGKIEAAFSGGSLVYIFTTNVNAAVISSYMETPDTTGAWTSTDEVADFKSNEDIRIVTGPGLKKLPRGTEADHAAYSDSYETYKIARYARQFVIDEQDIIDDRFNIFADTPKRFGAAAGRLRPDLVYGLILANPTLTATARALFNSTDGNLNTSVSLTSTNLKAAISEMRLLQENGVNINSEPTHLLIPPSLDFTARELLNSSIIVIAGTAGSVTERGATNTLDGLVDIVIEKRLENGVVYPHDEATYSGSATTWYLLSTNVPTVKVCYLRGTGKVPRVRSFTLEQGKWGMGWDVNLDIGAAALDWRGLQKNTA